jgi:hypothetical protein
MINQPRTFLLNGQGKNLLKKLEQRLRDGEISLEEFKKCIRLIARFSQREPKDDFYFFDFQLHRDFYSYVRMFDDSARFVLSPLTNAALTKGHWQVEFDKVKIDMERDADGNLTAPLALAALLKSQQSVSFLRNGQRVTLSDFDHANFFGNWLEPL